MEIEITPAQLHMSIDESVSAGLPPMLTITEPGIHGASVIGIHGIGVRTPRAAAVAAATVGLANDWHMPKGKMLLLGTLSVITAAGRFSTVGRTGSGTIKTLGANPKLHLIWAPIVTGLPICPPRVCGVVAA